MKSKDKKITKYCRKVVNEFVEIQHNSTMQITKYKVSVNGFYKKYVQIFHRTMIQKR